MATTEQIDEATPRVISHLKAGKSLTHACRLEGFHGTTPFSKRIKRVDPSLIPPARRRVIPRETKRTIAAEYLNGRDSYERVAARHGVSHKSVAAWAEQLALGVL